jgi:hypothetical protein
MGLSVSAYVLAQALPVADEGVASKVRAVTRSLDGLAELGQHLARVGDDDFDASVEHVDLVGLSTEQTNAAAAVVEREAWRRGRVPPAWTVDVDAPERPHFAWALRSLRPFLMQITPPAFKCRNLYLPDPGEAHAASGGARRVDGHVSGPPPSPESVVRLQELDDRLARTTAKAEILLVGGAVMTLVFCHEPETRRPRALLETIELLDEAVGAVRRTRAAPSDWLSRSVRRVLGSDWPGGRVWEGQRLSVFAPPPEYVLAWKCFELGRADQGRDRAIRSDLRYVARLLDLSTGEDILGRVDTYFTPRQLASDLEARLDDLIG